MPCCKSKWEVTLLIEFSCQCFRDVKIAFFVFRSQDRCEGFCFALVEGGEAINSSFTYCTHSCCLPLQVLCSLFLKLGIFGVNN